MDSEPKLMLPSTVVSDMLHCTLSRLLKKHFFIIHELVYILDLSFHKQDNVSAPYSLSIILRQIAVSGYILFLPTVAV